MPDSPDFRPLKPASKRASAAARGASRKSGTKPEETLRKAVWRRGLRYRKNDSSVPGKPDLAFRRARVAVFCDGDFWHGKNWPARKRKLEQGHNAAYWIAKIERNRRRDASLDSTLTAAGWQVVRYWESEIRSDPEALADHLAAIVASRRRCAERSEKSGSWQPRGSEVNEEQGR